MTLFSRGYKWTIYFGETPNRETQNTEAERQKLRQHLIESYTEQGRQAFLQGQTSQAVLYLNEAYRMLPNPEKASPALRTLLTLATRPLQALRATLGEGIIETAFTPDGSQLITVHCDGEVRVWDTTNWQSRTTSSDPGIRYHGFGHDSDCPLQTNASAISALFSVKPFIKSAALSPDGSYLIITTLDGTGAVEVRRTADGQSLKRLEAHASAIHYVAFSQDSTLLATASADGTAKVWELASGEPRKTFESQAGAVQRVAFSPDGKRLVMQTEERLLHISSFDLHSKYKGIRGRVWLTTDHRLRSALQDAPLIHSAFFNSDGSHLVTGRLESTDLWDMTTGKPTSAPQDRLHAIARSTDNKRTAFIYDTTAEVEDHTTSVSRSIQLKPTLNTGRSAFFSPDGSRLAIRSLDTVQVWDTTTGQANAFLTGAPYWIDFSPDSSHLVTVDRVGTVEVSDATSGVLLVSLTSIIDMPLSQTAEGAGWRVADRFPGAPEKQVAALIPIALDPRSPDGMRFVTRNEDGTVSLWNIAKALRIGSDDTQSYQSFSFTFLGNKDKYVISGQIGNSQDVLNRHQEAGTVRLLDSAADGLRRVLETKTSNEFFSLFSPNGAYLITASVEGPVHVWDAATGEQRAELPCHTAEVTSAVFSRESTFLVTPVGIAPRACGI